jgi:hypothetical protein
MSACHTYTATDRRMADQAIDADLTALAAEIRRATESRNAFGFPVRRPAAVALLEQIEAPDLYADWTATDRAALDLAQHDTRGGLRGCGLDDRDIDWVVEECLYQMARRLRTTGRLEIARCATLVATDGAITATAHAALCAKPAP